jgi:hypothetical protein
LIVNFCSRTFMGFPATRASNWLPAVLGRLGFWKLHKAAGIPAEFSRDYTDAYAHTQTK